MATVNPWVPPRASSPPNRIDPISALLHLFEDSHTPHTIHTDKHTINYTQTNTQSHMCVQTHTTHTTHVTDTQRHTHSETALFFAKLYKDIDLCCRSYRGSILVHRNTQIQSIGNCVATHLMCISNIYWMPPVYTGLHGLSVALEALPGNGMDCI